MRGAGGKPGNILPNSMQGMPPNQHPHGPQHPNMPPSMGFPGINLNNNTDEIGTNMNPDLMPWEQQHSNMDPLSNSNPNSSSSLNVSNCATSSTTASTMTTTASLNSGPLGSSLLSDASGLDVDSLVPGSPLGGRMGSNNIPLNSKVSGVQPNLQSPSSIGNLPLGAISPNLAGSMKPSLQGVKVPDENLTPQQLQHREEQLAKLKLLKCHFLPELGPSNMPGGGLGVPGGSVPGTPSECNIAGDGGPNGPPCKIPMMAANAATGGNTMGGPMPNMGPGNVSIFLFSPFHTHHIPTVLFIYYMEDVHPNSRVSCQKHVENK